MPWPPPSRIIPLIAGMLSLIASARGDTLISNLDSGTFPVTTAGSSPFPTITGQSFVTGPTDMVLQDVKIELDPTNMPTYTPTLVLEDSVAAVDGNSQNYFAPNNVVYTDLSLTSTDPLTGILTYTANSPFTLTGGGFNYWLIATPTGTDTGLSWSFNAPGQTPLETDGYTIQPNDASFYSYSDLASATYINPGVAVQLFQLDATPAPEPSTISLAVIAACALLSFNYGRIRRASRRTRPLPARSHSS